MALINCPVCGHEVSTEAIACPNCGHPISQRPAGVPQTLPTPPPAVALPADIRPVSFGLSATVAGFWWATAAGYALAGVVYLATWGLWTAYGNGDAALDDLTTMEAGADGLQGLAVLGVWIAGILFIIWFFQAYKSGQSRGPTGRTWAAGWTIGSWFIPLANFVIPKLVINEVDRMSNPDTGPAPIDVHWKQMPRLFSSDAWWALLVVGGPVFFLGQILYYSGDTYASSETGAAFFFDSVGSLLLAGAAALAGVVVFKIGRRLQNPI